MQYRIDGDQLMLCANSFVNLQESPAMFIPMDDELAKAILAESISGELADLLPPPPSDDDSTLPVVRSDKNYVYVEYQERINQAIPMDEFLEFVQEIMSD